LTIPDSVTHIARWAFSSCTSLTAIPFHGNAPVLGADVFLGTWDVSIFHLPGTIGWGSDFGGRPTAFWELPYPVILALPPSFGVKTNAFGFIVSWATNASVVVEGCTDLNHPLWAPLGTNTLIAGWSYFSDPGWTNHPGRFYRIRSP
jgi:hypothetical protein